MGSNDLSCFIEWNEVNDSKKEMIELLKDSVFEIKGNDKSYLVICGFRKLLIVRYSG
jgi:hypothetical protein